MPLMFNQKLLSELHDGVLTLTLNRPEKLNAIDNDMARSLFEAIEASATDKAVRAVRLRGSPRAFCAGRDLSAPPSEQDLVLVQAVAKAIIRSPKLVMAEVQGWAVGAGFEWMLCADVVIAAESARFKLPEASLGVFVTGGLSATLPASIGLARAKGLALLGDVTSDHPDMRISQIRLAALAPQVAMQFKRVFNLLGIANFDKAQDEENATQRVLGTG